MKKLLLFFILISSQLMYSQSDCINAIPICGNLNINYTPFGHGNQELPTTNVPQSLCLKSGEHYSVWYKFKIATSGTLNFVIDANVNSDDYDFAVYGPNPSCTAASLLTPIRCNYAGASPTGNTGLSATTGTYFEAELNVIAGEEYILLVDNFVSSANGFSLSFGGTATLLTPFDNQFAHQYQPNPFIAPLPIKICENPTLYNFNTLSPGIINGNPNFVVKYYLNSSNALDDINAINGPIMVNANNTYFYAITYIDPVNPTSFLNLCREFGTVNFIDRSFKLNNATLTECNNNNVGTATYNLTAAAINPTSIPNLTIKYYASMADLNNNIPIANPGNYVSAEKTVYAKASNQYDCTYTAQIQLKFYPTIILTPAKLESCFIETDVTRAKFDLTSAVVTSMSPVTKKFYRTLADATSGVNEILPANEYITTSTDVYVRVFDANGCWAITKITLVVLPPVKSAILKDKTICIEDRTTLDAGPGFLSYEWSTGATTASISGVAVGAYWVKLQTGKCYTTQYVNVYPSNQPVISTLDITNNNITITANGGVPAYQYSIDGINWQTSNVFSGLPRGENTVYVKDSYDCDPVSVTVTVPNLVNAITPNGDNVNDMVDYSALAYKKDLVFTVYNRYGNKIYVSDKIRNYKWDGTSGGKKIETGTYWYTITWTENDKNATQTKYSGWILVKNRE
ncbi:chromophore lyase [Chryseobacterium sp. Leaf404]|uniref:T9SS type B sorting domain-containing protein n=1 Tax=unclassified Chryseobacterium TaxID=2593645 RepID=UPI0006FBCEB3|nr:MULTISPECIES: gliding motility-associated C-terminal domain-containing protein [unclassified Chryseobacterium]KQT15549.1 chromophore lyase [Chryseobacterium sp. Leaf404]